MIKRENIIVPSEKIQQFCKKWNVVEMAFFGSVLRGDFDATSDVDILVTFKQGSEYDLFDFVTMTNELGAIFGREVDLVERDSLTNPFRRDHILQNLEIIYAA